MPKKGYKRKAGEPRWRAWTAQEISILRRLFGDTTNRELALTLGRGIKSIIWQATQLGLKKSPEHRSRQAIIKATAYAEANPEAMAAIGARGGKIGGASRAAALTAKRRREIAYNAIQSRWSAVHPSSPGAPVPGKRPA